MSIKLLVIYCLKVALIILPAMLAIYLLILTPRMLERRVAKSFGLPDLELSKGAFIASKILSLALLAGSIFLADMFFIPDRPDYEDDDFRYRREQGFSSESAEE